MSDSEDEVDQHQFKVILLGDGAVGKTSIAMRFCNNHFAQQYKQTIGLDFFMKRLVLPGNTQVAMQVWDIGGQSIGGKMIKNYIYGAHAVLLCYDITSKDSFQNLEDWYRLVRKTFEKAKMPYTALVGNKTDMSHLRAISRDKHNNFAEENDLNGTINPLTKICLNNQGTSITLQSRRNCFRYLLTDEVPGSSGVPRFTNKTPTFAIIYNSIIR